MSRCSCHGLDGAWRVPPPRCCPFSEITFSRQKTFFLLKELSSSNTIPSFPLAVNWIKSNIQSEGAIPQFKWNKNGRASKYEAELMTSVSETVNNDLHALAEAFVKPNHEPETKAESLVSGFLKKLGLHATNRDHSNTHNSQNGEDYQEVILWEKRLMAGADPNAKNLTGEVKHAHLFLQSDWILIIIIWKNADHDHLFLSLVCAFCCCSWQTPFHIVCMRGNYHVVRTSTTYWEWVYIGGTLGISYCSCFILNIVQAEMLLEGKHISDINATNAHGETALDFGMYASL